MLIMPLERVVSAFAYCAALSLIASEVSPARAAGSVEVRLDPTTGRDPKTLTYNLATKNRSGLGLTLSAASKWSPGIAHWSDSGARASGFQRGASEVSPGGDIAVFYRRLMYPRFTYSRRRIAVALTTGF